MKNIDVGSRFPNHFISKTTPKFHWLDSSKPGHYTHIMHKHSDMIEIALFRTGRGNYGVAEKDIWYNRAI